jgi:hypothetical protein
MEDMMNISQKIIFEPLQKCLEKIMAFLPNLLTSLVLLIAGIIIGLVVKIIFSKFFKAVGLDGFAARFGFPDLLKKGGIREPLSLLLSKFIGGIIVLVFAILSMRALEVLTVEKLLEKFLLYLPNILVALLILLSGYLLGNFFGRAALIAAVNAGMRLSRLVGAFVKYTIIILSATMALEHVGIGKETVEIAFAIVFGGVVLALALAFGLGSKDLAKDYLVKKLRGEKEQDEEEGIGHL